MRLGLVCGSLGDRSANAAALDVVESWAIAASVEAVMIEGVGELPPFAPQHGDAPPPTVERFQQDLTACDAVVIAAPEYAAGLAGSMKNALDWLVGAATLYRKPVAVLSAGTTGGPFALEQLVQTLSWQGAYVLSTLGISAPRAKMDNDGHLDDAKTIAEIHAFADRLVIACRSTPADRLEALTAAIEPFGIDPARFGEIS